MNNPFLDGVVERLEGASRVLIFGHARPDGDAIGSTLGLMWLLRGLGKQADVSIADPIGISFQFLPGIEEVADRPLAGHDLVVALDGSDAGRYGANFTAAHRSDVFVLAIDHHKTNTRFADLNWVDPYFAATAEMLVHLARHAGWALSEEVATCLATGCVTDTNAFSTDHTTPEVLEAVAVLMREGAPLSTIIRHSMSLRTPTDAMLWGRILATLQVEGGVAWAVNRTADRAALGASLGDGGGVSTFLRDIVGVDISVLFIETYEGTVRLSMRSRRGYDVGTLAFALGGGGHTQAAGATLDLPLDETMSLVLGAVLSIVPQPAVKPEE